MRILALTPARRKRAREIARWLLAALFVGMGVAHFAAPDFFVAIVPPQLPSPLALVYISGAAEMAGGVAVLVPRLRRPAGWGLILLLIAVLPANIYEIHHPRDGGPPDVPWGYLRLPLQGVFIAWVWWTCLARNQPEPD